jgi:hypothetical protein
MPSSIAPVQDRTGLHFVAVKQVEPIDRVHGRIAIEIGERGEYAAANSGDGSYVLAWQATSG